jgi:RNA polymerase sigma-70 factor (ECF subfamily)
LPEPVTGVDAAGPDDEALDISFAVMRTLERLSPPERAAFFLHDLWGMTFEEVGTVLSRSPATCRKLASRARTRLAEARRRFRPDRAAADRLAAALREAVARGDPAPLKAVFADDIELVGDGGGKVITVRNVIRGADAVARFLVGVATKNPLAGETALAQAVVNDAAALLVMIRGTVDQVMAFDLDSAGRIKGLYLVRNPDKLAAVRA